jgi:hypothetical protein
MDKNRNFVDMPARIHIATIKASAVNTAKGAD